MVNRFRAEITPHRVWMFLFFVWAVLLSGFFGQPGVIQAVRLNNLLQAKRVQVDKMQDAVARLQTDAANFEKNKLLQQKEIRRVLGYAATDELIFDFSSGESL